MNGMKGVKKREITINNKNEFMKTIKTTTMKQLTFLLVLLAFLGCNQTESEDADLCNLIAADCEWSEAGFQTPLDESNIQVWYHWINGHLSKEEITKDMESMKEMGIGGFTNFNVGEGTPPGNAPYESEEWWDIFIHAKKEAKRLGLEMGLMNCPGWATSGGPWNTPDNAMQEVVWTEQQLAGPSEFSAILSIPEPVLGLERDMKRDTFINKRYYMPKKHCEGYYNDIAVLAFPTPKKELNGEKPYQISRWWYKAGYKKLKHNYVRDTRQAPQSEIVNLDEIIDITDKLDEDGNLQWDVPEGNWTILRVGYQPTGRSTHPAPKGGKGLEIDRMSAKAMDIHFQESVMKLVNAGGEGLNDVIKNVLFDSYEAGHQNWTKGFEKKFTKSMGYDITKYLPAIAGRVVISTDETEDFLWDFRKVISDLMVENYYKHFQTLAHQNGLTFQAEHYGNFGNTDDFESGTYVDVSANEFWANQGNHHAGITKLSSSIAHVYGRKLVGSEAFTGNPARIFETNPRDIKAQGDWMYAKGINQFWLHGFTHSPYKQTPGLGLGTYGSHFHRRNTWWPHAHAWVSYLNRCQYMLQQGNPHNDILLFPGEDASVDPSLLEKIRPEIPFGYDYDFCNRDILEKAKVVDGKIVLPNGLEYALLVVQDNDQIRPGTLQTIAKLVKSGATLVASKPIKIPTLEKYDEGNATFLELSKQLWGDADGKNIMQNKLGKGMVYWGKPIEDIFKEKDIAPDFEFVNLTKMNYGETLFHGNGMEFIHRQTDATDVYFVSNQHDQAKTIRAKFRITGKLPELWNPETGEIMDAPEYKKLADGRMEVTLRMEEAGSVFVVFRKSLTQDSSDAYVAPETLAELDFAEPWNVSFTGNGAPEAIVMNELTDISKHELADVRYFAGMISYENNIHIDEKQDGVERILNLGEVHVSAEVIVNGKSAGVLWKRPYKLDITEALVEGENKLKVNVANLWVNRIVGDQELPDDCEWTTNTGSTAKGMGLAKVPEWVLEGKDSPTGRRAFVGWKWEHMKGKELKPSGLIGPVTISVNK
ncbi:MAG: hypothetical protein GY790_15555 [Bacteroidetes bacterium]|nr:hypothetical protein [Bacteroidota bacterium]